MPAAGRLDCLVCSGEGRERRAWFVVDGGSLCIRHAAHAATTTDEYGDDDMGAHDFAHAVYQELGRLGVPHAY
ncbi:MAG TPA: hypothetical protein VFS29_10290 [Motilibacteraceae bacterium]|nr:hypothetical protein [Motilibacteraceae bacterium]